MSSIEPGLYGGPQRQDQLPRNARRGLKVEPTGATLRTSFDSLDLCKSRPKRSESVLSRPQYSLRFRS